MYVKAERLRWFVVR